MENDHIVDDMSKGRSCTFSGKIHVGMSIIRIIIIVRSTMLEFVLFEAPGMVYGLIQLTYIFRLVLGKS